MYFPKPTLLAALAAAPNPLILAQGETSRKFAQSTIESQKQGRRGRTLLDECNSYSDCPVSTNPCEYGNGICNFGSKGYTCKYAHIDGCVNGATLDTWFDIKKDELIELKSDSRFPDHPDVTVSLTERLETERNRGANFGARLQTYLMAPLTCDFNFYISSNNDGELNLSTDTDPTNKVKIANIRGFVGFVIWDKYESQKSVPISLVKGELYYLEALHKEEGGGDHLSIGWECLDHDLAFEVIGAKNTMLTLASASPSTQPSTSPSKSPSKQPSTSPSVSPSTPPSTSPSKSPSKQPSTSPSASPSTQPSKSPTTSPSMQPSATPTREPSNSPSTSPSKESYVPSTILGPWDIVFVNMTVDFGVNSTQEVVQNFQIGKSRDFDYDFYTSDCVTKTDIAGVASVTSKKSAGADALHDALSLNYDFNKSAIAMSGIWNASASKINFCQKLRLKQGGMHIAEDVRKIDVVFDLDADFNFTNRLGGGTTNAANGSTSADDYVTAFKCNGGDFNSNTSPLVPNGELLVCIKSASGDFEIAALESMAIDQGDTNMNVIVNGEVEYSSITSRTYDGNTKVWVSTRVPLNSFDYETVGASIAVSGKVILKLTDGSDRRLQANIDTDVTGANQQSGFELQVKLQGGETVEVGASVNSGKSVVARTLVMLGAIFAPTYGLW